MILVSKSMFFRSRNPINMILKELDQYFMTKHAKSKMATDASSSKTNRNVIR